MFGAGLEWGGLLQHAGKVSMKKRAFTLIELLMVILIIGILVGIMSSAIKNAVANARKKLVSSNIATLTQAVQTYRHEYNVWPLPPGDASATTGTKKYGGTNRNNSAVVNLLKDTGNANKINFLGNGDYTWDSSRISIVSPTNSKYAFTFEFNLDNDSVSVY